MREAKIVYTYSLHLGDIPESRRRCCNVCGLEGQDAEDQAVATQGGGGISSP